MMTEDQPTPVFTVESAIGPLEVRADSSRSVFVSGKALTISRVEYSKINAYASLVYPSQVVGRAEGDFPAWMIGSWSRGHFKRREGLYLRRENFAEPTESAIKKARKAIEEAVTAWAQTDEGVRALYLADGAASRRMRFAAKEQAQKLRETADLIERVADAIAKRSPLIVTYREARNFYDESTAGIPVAYWHAGPDRSFVTITPRDHLVPSNYTNPEVFR